MYIIVKMELCMHICVCVTMKDQNWRMLIFAGEGQYIPNTSVKGKIFWYIFMHSEIAGVCRQENRLLWMLFFIDNCWSNGNKFLKEFKLIHVHLYTACAFIYLHHILIVVEHDAHNEKFLNFGSAKTCNFA